MHVDEHDTPARQLVGMCLDNKWDVVEQLERPPGSTGGTFSTSYVVTNAKRPWPARRRYMRPATGGFFLDTGESRNRALAASNRRNSNGKSDGPCVASTCTWA